MTAILKTKATYNYKGTEVVVLKTAYANGDNAALVISPKDNLDAVQLVPSVNLPAESTGKDETFIKDYSENSGVKAWLIENNIISAEVLGSARSGFVEFTKHAIINDAFEPHTIL